MFEFQQLIKDLHPEKLEDSKRNIVMNQSEKLRILYDSNKYPKEYQNPIGCQLELTHQCNLNCLHCYNCSGMKRPELSIRQWTNVAKQLAKMEIFECVISGGEPLLLKNDLHKIMSVLADSGVRFIFITNGLLGNREIVDKLAKYDYSWLQVSIDGHSEKVHDEIRGVKGSWKKAVSTASHINEAGLPLVISHVIMHQNADFVSNAIENFYALGALRVITGKFIYSGRAITNRDKIELTEKQESELIPNLEKLQAKWSNKMEISVPTDISVYLRLRMLEPPSVILIRPNGDVKLDCTLPFTIGNVKNKSLHDIWQDAGKNAWNNKQLKEWVERTRKSQDVLINHPKPYFDDPVAIG